MENIVIILTPEQVKDICNHYGENVEEMMEWEIGELVDRLIDDFLYG
jgi:hypothetical protein